MTHGGSFRMAQMDRALYVHDIQGPLKTPTPIGLWTTIAYRSQAPIYRTRYSPENLFTDRFSKTRLESCPMHGGIPPAKVTLYQSRENCQLSVSHSNKTIASSPHPRTTSASIQASYERVATPLLCRLRYTILACRHVRTCSQQQLETASNGPRSP